ncbi:MAG: hypothetical protein U0236_08295 [Nitrospira sp.]
MTRIDTFLCVSCLTLLCSTGFKAEVQRSAAFDAEEQRNMAVTGTEHIKVAGNPGENCATVGDVSSPDLTQPYNDIHFATFTFTDEDFSFEGPTDWLQPSDPEDLALKAFFMGPVDRTHHSVVLLDISRYQGKAASIQQEINRLQTIREAEVLMHRICTVDQRPAHFLTLRDRIAVPMWESDVLRPILYESFVIFQDGLDMYVLGYASTPEFYDKYQPLFDRLIASVRFHSDKKQRSSQR